MSQDEKRMMAVKFHDVFKLVSANENHQHPELIDKANQILRYLSKIMPKEPAREIFEPLPHAEHPALAFARSRRARPTNSREVVHEA